MFSRAKEEKIPTHIISEFHPTKKGQKVPFSILGNQTFFKGKIILKGEARLAGEVEGTIVAEDFLILEEGASVKGDIQGTIVEIHGSFEGTLHVTDSLRLSSTARIEGDIAAHKLVVEEGAKIQGKIMSLETSDPRLEGPPLSVVV